MADWMISLNAQGTGTGAGWGNNASLANTQAVLNSMASGDRALFEPGYDLFTTAGPFTVSVPCTILGQTRGGVNNYAGLRSNRTPGWQPNGVWVDGATVGSVTYPTLTPATQGSDIFWVVDAAAQGAGTVFQHLKFRDLGTAIRPKFSAQGVRGKISVANLYSYNVNGLVYPQQNSDGQCQVTAQSCTSVGYSLGMIRAFNNMYLTDCHGDAQNQFMNPGTNLFGFHVQDAIVDQVTATAATSQIGFTNPHGMNVGDIITVVAIAAGSTPLVVGTVYYVQSVPSSTTLTLSATLGGGLLTITADGTLSVQLTQARYDLQFNDVTMINHAASAPLGSSRNDPTNPAVMPYYLQGDGGVAEENTNVLPSADAYFGPSGDRGFDGKPPIAKGNIKRIYCVGNGYSVAAHDDTVQAWYVDCYFSTSARLSNDPSKSSNIQASGQLFIDHCIMYQAETNATQYCTAYGSVQAAHTQSGVLIPQRCGAMTVMNSQIFIKTGLTKAILAGGGSPFVTPTYAETNTTTTVLP